MRRSIPFILFLLALHGGPAAAHDMRHHGAHVHGQAQLDVALDGQTLELQLTSPGIGILDFEHPVRDASERARLDAALAVLRGTGWLLFPVAAACASQHVQVDAEGYETPAGAHDEGGHHHAGFRAHYLFQCAHPDRLDHLQVLLPQRFPGLQKVVVIATAAGQDRAEVVAGQPRVNLPG